jgi:hypothetical protein
MAAKGFSFEKRPLSAEMGTAQQSVPSVLLWVSVFLTIVQESADMATIHLGVLLPDDRCISQMICVLAH